MALFRPPKFLEMPAVGIDISDDAVRFIDIAPRGDTLEVVRYAAKNFPFGVIKEGHIRDIDKLRETITAIASEHHLSYANISLPEEQAYLVNIHLPHVPQGEIRSAIELRLEEYVPISPAEAIFDFTVLTEHDGYDVVVSVLPRSVVEEYHTIFDNTGIIPKALEFESQAMARAVIPAGDMGTTLVIDIGKMITEIFVVANGVVQFSASLDIGGYALTTAIARGLECTEHEAEEKKVAFGLVPDIANRAVYDAMLPVMSDIRTRLMRHYVFWETHHGEKVGDNISQVLLTGGGANMKGLIEFFAQEINVPIRIANPWCNMGKFDRYVPPIMQHDALGYAAAIGLALRDHRKP